MRRWCSTLEEAEWGMLPTDTLMSHVSTDHVAQWLALLLTMRKSLLWTPDMVQRLENVSYYSYCVVRYQAAYRPVPGVGDPCSGVESHLFLLPLLSVELQTWIHILLWNSLEDFSCFPCSALDQRELILLLVVSLVHRETPSPVCSSSMGWSPLLRWSWPTVQSWGNFTGVVWWLMKPIDWKTRTANFWKDWNSWT